MIQSEYGDIQLFSCELFCATLMVVYIPGLILIHYLYV